MSHFFNVFLKKLFYFSSSAKRLDKRQEHFKCKQILGNMIRTDPLTILLGVLVWFSFFTTIKRCNSLVAELWL